MVELVKINGEFIFAPNPSHKQGKFLETYPSIDLFQRILPICVINSVKVNDDLDGRLNIENRKKQIDKISPFIDTNGNKFIRYVQQEFRQEFRYVLHFILKDPTRDMLSEVQNPGILDQCKIYISQNGKVLSEIFKPETAITTESIKYYITVDVVSSEHITQYASDGIYILSLEILFRDRLSTLIEELAMSGTLKIEKPVEVEVNGC
jgi:hypothetical protein